jgi:TctA family transporter
MARQGRAGPALAIAAIGSFFAGCVGTLFVAALAPALALLTTKFTSVEYFSLMVLGLLSAVVMAQGSIIKAVAMIFVGLLFGLAGTDVNTGTARFTFGVSELFDGIGFLPLVMGLFGINEVMTNLEQPHGRELIARKVENLWLSRKDFHEAWPAVLRGTGLGSLLGILPGGGAVLASFASYMVEKKVARDPSRFGRGAIEGVAGPESANNAAAQTSFIPLLTLGLPSNVVMALMMGAMIIQGIAPGSAVMDKRPDLFWGMVASMWIGNLMLLVINLPLIGIWVRLLNIPYRLLYPCILVFCLIGIYTVNNSTTDVLLTVLFSAFGYLLIKVGCEPAPMVLGFILGPLMEENLRRSMVLSRGDPSIFFTRPISLVLLLLAAGLLALVVLPQISATREKVFQE